jgi:hypothetical protein
MCSVTRLPITNIDETFLGKKMFSCFENIFLNKLRLVAIIDISYDIYEMLMNFTVQKRENVNLISQKFYRELFSLSNRVSRLKSSFHVSKFAIVNEYLFIEYM